MLITAWFTLAMEGHPSVSAYASVSTGSYLEVCDISSTEAEEATEEKGTICSFRLRFRRAYPLVLLSPFS